MKSKNYKKDNEESLKIFFNLCEKIDLEDLKKRLILVEEDIRVYTKMVEHCKDEYRKTLKRMDDWVDGIGEYSDGLLTSYKKLEYINNKLKNL